jgi:hypothetical protein
MPALDELLFPGYMWDLRHGILKRRFEANLNINEFMRGDC